MASKSDNAENGSTAAAPEGTADGGGYASLSTRDQEILAKAMTCLKAQPEVSTCSRIQIPWSQSYLALYRLLFACTIVQLPTTMLV